jgi:hypothetical protein
MSDDPSQAWLRRAAIENPSKERARNSAQDTRAQRA